MTKNKLKLSLIDDYIKIILIKNFYNNSFKNFNINENTLSIMTETKQLNKSLEKFYDYLLTKLNKSLGIRVVIYSYYDEINSGLITLEYWGDGIYFKCENDNDNIE